MFNEILEILLGSNDEGFLLEYIKGGKRYGAKYLNRFGFPGNYSYIYPSGNFAKYSRKVKFFFSRFMKKSQRFLNRIRTNYEAKKLDVKPKNWSNAIINVVKRDGSILRFHVDTKSHHIYSYKSKGGRGGGAASLSTAKRRGILRYR